MVGVPGRSKGCNTCRKRKKGCDQQRPSCGQCRRAGIQCAGYERPRVFVNASQPLDSVASTSLAVSRVSPDAAHPVDVTLPQGLARSAYELKYLGLFWDLYLPRGPLSSDMSRRYLCGSWSSVARDLYRDDIALRKALLAMCLGTVGRHEGRRWMAEEGLKAYVAALSETTAALNDPARRNSVAILASSRALGLYELLYGADDKRKHSISQIDSWQGHNVGELALITQRPPSSFAKGHAHLLFADGRMSLMISSFVRRQRCALSDPVWKSAPWAVLPKTPKDKLLDIMVDIPGLMEDTHRLEEDVDPSSNDPDFRIQVLEECWRIDAELTSWEEHFAPLDALAELRTRGYENPTADDVAVAQSMTLYWTACVLTYSSLRKALLSGPSSSPGAIAALPARTDPMIHCAAIADLVEIFFQPSAGTFGWHAAPFPMGAALMFLGSTWDKKGPPPPVMLKTLSYFSRERGGQTVGDFLSSRPVNDPYEKLRPGPDGTPMPNSPPHILKQATTPPSEAHTRDESQPPP